TRAPSDPRHARDTEVYQTPTLSAPAPPGRQRPQETIDALLSRGDFEGAGRALDARTSHGTPQPIDESKRKRFALRQFLLRAKKDLFEGRVEEGLVAARRALELDPGNREGEGLLAEAEARGREI